MNDFRKTAKLLKNFGVVDWVLCDEEMLDFMDWFENNIDESNILTDNEITEYDEILRNGKTIFGEDLAKEVRKIENKFPDILSCSDQKVSHLEAELQHVQSQADAYEELAAHIRFSVNETVGTIAELESKVNDSEIDIQAMIRTCFESAKQLEELQADNQRTIAELNRCYSNEQTKLLFMHQMPVEREYLQRCSTLLNTIKLYMQSNFKTQQDSSCVDEGNAPYPSCEAPALTTANQFDTIVKSFFNVNHDILTAQMECNATRALIEKTKVCPSMTQSITSASLAQDIVDIETQSDTLPMHIETKMETLRQQLQQLAEHEIEFIVAQNNDEKLRRVTERLGELKNLAKLVTSILTNADIIWSTLQLDLEKLKACKSFDKTDRLRTEATQSAKRLNSINSLVRTPIAMHSMDTLFLRELQTLLATHVTTLTPNTLAECLQEYAKLMKQTPARLDTLIGRHHLKFTTEQMDRLKLAEKILSECLVTGPVKKPALCNELLVSTLYDADKEMQSLQKKIKAIQIDLVNHGNRMRNDSLWRNKLLLWLWFLVEPKLICDAIREVKTKLKAIEEQPMATKVLAGLRRKT